VILYKIRHIPTGLYFKPNSNPYRKSSLSKDGKVYHKKPNLKVFLKCGYYHPTGKCWSSGMTSKDLYEHRQYVPEEWEIVELKVT
jgi:hypothetical protein